MGAARSLELAHRSLLAGGLAVGSVIIDDAEVVIAEGRNRAYDDATGADPLERTPIAHAEMNAMARLDIEAAADRFTLWSTQLPCPMCRAAADFIGIGNIVAIATDPSAPEHRADESLDDIWVILATTMFLAGPVRRGGRDHPTVQANLLLEPESVALAELVANGSHPLVDESSLQGALAATWTDLTSAAAGREQRRTTIREAHRSHRGSENWKISSRSPVVPSGRSREGVRTMRRTVFASVVALGLFVVATPASARAVDYDLPNAGVLLEGIGVDARNRVFYVSGVNDGGDVYRGRLGEQQLERWVDGAGTTGRGIDVDDAGRVFVAGGPSGAVRVFDRSGTLLTTLATGATGSFLNDVWVDRDGSVYVSDSSLPKIWRITSTGGAWTISEWLDVSASIAYTPSTTDFDLGGIVTDGDILLTSQGTTGQLWRIDMRTKQITEVDLGGTRIFNADGIALRGSTLWVVQNFSRQIIEIRLRRQATTGEVRGVTQTPANRTLTTAKLVRGDLLAVDSQFGFNAAAAPAADRVISLHP